MEGKIVYTGTKSRMIREDPSNPNEFKIGIYFSNNKNYILKYIYKIIFLSKFGFVIKIN